MYRKKKYSTDTPSVFVSSDMRFDATPNLPLPGVLLILQAAGIGWRQQLVFCSDCFTETEEPVILGVRCLPYSLVRFS